MKALTLLSMLPVLILGSPTQTSLPTQATEPLAVIGCSWTRAERSVGSSGNREKEARDAAIDQRIALETRENDPRNAKTAQEVQRLEQSKNTLALIPLPAGTVMGYEYRAIVRNESDKTIRWIQWSYVFTDVTTQKELTRQELSSRVQIKPGREKNSPLLLAERRQAWSTLKS